MKEKNLADIWNKIEIPVINNIKVYALRKYSAVILHYFNPKIDIIVSKYKRYLPPYVAENEAHDLKTIAQLEFFETLKKWEPYKYPDIWPLAYARIIGAMKDHIRYITKSNPAQLYDWITETAYFFMSGQESTTFESSIDTTMQLKSALETLSDRERRIIIEHIFKDKTFQEIGDKLKISGSQISRIYNKALAKMKKEFKK